MKIAAGCLRKLPPAATTAVLGRGRDLNLRRSEKMATFHGKNMTNPWDLDGFRVSKHQINPDLAKKNTGILMVKFWYGVLFDTI